MAGRERAERVDETDLEPGEPRLGGDVVPAHPDTSHRRVRAGVLECIEPLA
jgi:hypothetical protein